MYINICIYIYIYIFRIFRKYEHILDNNIKQHINQWDWQDLQDVREVELRCIGWTTYSRMTSASANEWFIQATGWQEMRTCTPSVKIQYAKLRRFLCFLYVVLPNDGKVQPPSSSIDKKSQLISGFPWQLPIWPASRIAIRHLKNTGTAALEN